MQQSGLLHQRNVHTSTLRCRTAVRRQTFACRRRFRFIISASTSTCLVEASRVDWKNDFHEKYVLERSLGHGSFGEVWLATERETRKKVAVKEMPKQRGRLSVEGTFAKVDREICVMKDLLSCPATVQLKECHALPSSYRIVMEYCSGLDLREQLKIHGPVHEKIVAHVAFEILQILKKCHKNRIVHGDVKTANFILRSAENNPFRSHDASSLNPGWLKAIDFGCSQYMLEGRRISSRVGTPVFMAPEVFDRDYGYESDLWSLGVVLYQLVSGRFPFWSSTQEALTSSFDDVMDKVHLEDPDFTAEPFTSCSELFVDFLSRLLDKDYMTRITAGEALDHPFIKQYVSQEKTPEEKISGNNNIVPANAEVFKASLSQ